MPPSNDLERMQQALIAADKAGDTQAATTLAQAIRAHSPSQSPQTQQAPQPTGLFPQAVSGVAEGVADVAGLPVDTANALANLATAGYGMGRQLIGRAMGEPGYEAASHAPATEPAGDVPMSSDWIKAKLQQTGLTAQTPQTTGERVVRGVGEFAGSAAVPLGKTKTVENAGLTLQQQAVKEMQKAGLILPPVEANPSLLNKYAQGFAGKITTQQAASIKNQTNFTNRLARQALGIPDKVPLTKQVLAAVRDQAGEAYETLKTYPKSIEANDSYYKKLDDLSASYMNAAKKFPTIFKSAKPIDNLKDTLHVSNMTPDEAVETMKQLRFSANENMKALGDPSKRALGFAQRKAADAIEGLIDDNLKQSGDKQILVNFRKAREIIAKSHAVEDSLNEVTGNVSAQKLSAMLDKKKPLTDELLTIARAYKTSPKSLQDVGRIGSEPGISPLDTGVFGMSSIIRGKLWPLLLTSGRPLTRSMILSRPYQTMFATPSQGMYRMSEILQNHPLLPIAAEKSVTP